MTFVPKQEFCIQCGKIHPVGSCQFPTLETGLDVDKSSNIMGSYRTLYFRCPKCNNSFILLNSNYCYECGAKLNWK